MDPYTAMETIGEGAKAATKLGEIIEKVFGPRWTRKQADADAYADEKKLQTIRDNPDMEIVYVDGKINARLHQGTQDALAFRAEQRMLSELIRQEENIENVLEVTAKELPSYEAVSDDPVDDDWITRFFSIVKDINNEDMQYVWGKILAGEIAAPKSFSLKTLDTLRNISSAEALIFQKIIPFVLRRGDRYFLPSKSELLRKHGSSFSDILSLDECGLVNSSGTLTLHIKVTQNQIESILNDEMLIALLGYKDNNVDIPIGIHTLTKAGRELYSILPHATNEGYMKDFAQFIFEENKEDVKTSLHKLKAIVKTETGDTIYYETAIASYAKGTSV